MKFTLAAITLLSSAFLYLPYLGAFDNIFRYWDGPLYVVVAKDFYSIQGTPFSLPPYYYSTHLIGYPLLIRVFSFIGYFPSMLFVTLLFSVLSILLFYRILKEFGYVKDPFFISLLFIFLPPRWLIYHSVGASEPVFIFFVLASFYLFKRERFFLSALCGAFATITKIHGIMLFPAYLLLSFRRREFLSYFMIPVFLALHFYWYKLAFNDFFAYFKWNVGLRTLNYPFHSVLEYGEGHLIIYFIYGLAIALLIRKHIDLALISAFLYLPLVFVVHPDLSRYMVPISPFALIAFQGLFLDRAVRVFFFIFLVPLYFYAWHTLSGNLAPLDAYLAFRASL